jgi:GWxTD domain-containing protein
MKFWKLKMSRNLITILFVFFAACSPKIKYSTTDFSTQYRNLKIEPRFRSYAVSGDSAMLLYEINKDGLLYRKNENGLFEASVILSYRIFADDHTSIVTDSGSVSLKIPFDSLNIIYNGTLKYKICSCINYVRISIADQNRNQTYIYGNTLDTRSAASSSFYNAMDNFGEELMSNVVSEGSSVNIIAPERKKQLTVRCYFREFPLALPPFSNNPPQTFDLHSDSSFVISESEPDGITLNRKGLYYFQQDTLSNYGYTVFCTDQDYPAFTNADQLIDALRYLTTKKEYEELISSNEKRKSIDQFWLEKAGNNERGRKLIRIYYGRAKDANVHFTSYTEGWKTDRGMIYIIFGPPATVYRDGDNEVWDYHYNEGIPPVRFVFTRMFNPFSENDYVLNRTPELQHAWYIAVDSWRTGRIAGDY